jgi:hypothetical protein
MMGVGVQAGYTFLCCGLFGVWWVAPYARVTRYYNFFDTVGHDVAEHVNQVAAL